MTLACGMLLASIAALYACSSSALTSSFCSNNGDVCFRWGVPEASEVSGSGNIDFQIKAPTSLTWAGLGIGISIQGAGMFLIYQNSNGNITLSMIIRRGHIMPKYTERSKVELLAGSGNNSNLLNSTRLSARISDSNSDSDSDSDSGSGFRNGVMSEVEGSSPSDIVLCAHGVIISIVFLAGYPLGAVLMPMIRKWFIHAGWQFIVFVGIWAGFALSYVYACNNSDWWKQAHTMMGAMSHHYHAHIWFGRVLMILGIINGGLGLQLAGSPQCYVIPYSAIAGIAAVLYIIGIFMSPQMIQEEQQ
ncbi:hypothetical protein DER46DRAFT_630199 [Fusarium sp. MPI-SDFR-AT-0072]|nr:hypothetical protein DER46DRAFT_630199 [Fusarium sp. MPI-SDFR-AT-0072]